MNDKIPTSSKSKIDHFILINQEEFIDYFNLILDFEISCKPSLSRNSSYFVMWTLQYLEIRLFRKLLLARSFCHLWFFSFSASSSWEW